MAGRRATQFAALVKEYREGLRISKAEVIGYFAASDSDEIPGWVHSKARRIIAREERRLNRCTR